MLWTKKASIDIEGELQQDKEECPNEAFGVENYQSAEQNVANDFAQLGQLLVLARNKSNFTKEQIIEKLKIKEANLDAIEAGNVDVLFAAMPMPFLRGFLREYCALLEAENLWCEYDRITSCVTGKTKKSYQPFNDVHEKHGFYRVNTTSKKNRIFFISFLLLIILLSIYFVYQLRDDIASQVISPSEIVMGLNPLDKVDSGEDKGDFNEDKQNNNFEANEAREEANQPRAASVDDAVSPSDGVQSRNEALDNTEKKLPTNPASFGWLDTDSKTAPTEGRINKIDTDTTHAPTLPPKNKREITVKAVNVLWIRVTTPNRRIFQGLMKKGEVKSFEVEGAPITIRYGKGNKALVTWNGVESFVSKDAKPIDVTYTLETR